jgi:nucleotide-binding universal stress UspA family protein
MTRRIVVGFDGSPAAVAAVTWAAGEARLRGAELVAWTVLDRPESRHAADSAAAKTPRPSLEEAAGGYPVTLRHGYGDAAAELVAACADADLLVVGSRGRGSLEGLVLGSVSRACLAQAPCPVVVRPQPEQGASHRRVIVGVDASEHSRQALRVAAEEARLRGAALHVLHAVYWDNSGEELLTPTRKQLVEWGRKLVAAELAATGVTGRPVVVPGHASEVLVRHSAHADLLVVASRGRNPVTGLLLGSTSEHCARHAQCPVMVNRARKPKPSGRAHLSCTG